MEKYAAFISYCHRELDSAVAARLHTLLERFRIPRELAKARGSKTVGRVFRDREELPISGDLAGSIREALDAADFLIVVCTPDTPKSFWVQKEIEYFLSIKPRNRVLTVLAAGEPATSFPPILIDKKIKQQGGETLPQIVEIIEPLAADVRADSRPQVLKRLRAETPRLIAALISCAYDDLQQRHRQHQRRKLLAAFLSSSLILLAFLGYALFKNAEISKRNAIISDQNVRLSETITGMQVNESRFLSEESTQLLESGLRSAAVYTALAALPKDDERPVVAEAELALSRALYAYETEQVQRVDRSFMIQGGTSLDRLVQSGDGKIFVYTNRDENLVVAIDTVSGRQLWSKTLAELLPGAAAAGAESVREAALRLEIDALDRVEDLFFVDRTRSVLLAWANGVACVDAVNGEARWVAGYGEERGTYYSLRLGSLILSAGLNRLYLITRAAVNKGMEASSTFQLRVLDAANGAEISSIPLPEFTDEFYVFQATVSDDGVLYLCSFTDSATSEQKRLLQVNAQTGEAGLIDRYPFDDVLFSYVPKGRDLVLCYVGETGGAGSRSDSAGLLQVLRLGSESGFPEKWHAETAAVGNQFDYYPYDVLAGKGWFFYQYPEDSRDMVAAVALNKRINRYAYSTGKLLSSRDIPNGMDKIIQSLEGNTLFLFGHNKVVDEFAMNKNILASEHPFFSLIQLGFRVTDNTVARNNVLIAEHEGSPVISVLRPLLDSNRRLLYPGMPYVSPTDAAYLPGKHSYVFIDGLYTEKRLVVVDEATSDMKFAMDLTGLRYSLAEAMLAPDGRLFLKDYLGNYSAVLDVGEGSLIPVILPEDQRTSRVFSDGDRLFIAGVRGYTEAVLTLYELAGDGEAQKVWERPVQYADADFLAVGAGRVVLPGRDDANPSSGMLNVFDLSGNHRVIKLDNGHNGWPGFTRTRMSPDGSCFALADDQGGFTLVDLEDLSGLFSLKETYRHVTDFDFVRGSGRLALVYNTGDVEFVDIASGAVIASTRLDGFSHMDSKVLAVDDERGICVIGSNSMEAFVFDTVSGRVRLKLSRFIHYAKETGQFLLQDRSESLLLYPYYETADLISLGEAMLAEQQFSEVEKQLYFISR